MSKENPESFNDLSKKQLVEAAEYFGTENEGNVTLIKTSLADDGITWEMYAEAFGLNKTEKEELNDVVTSEDVRNIVEEDEVLEAETVEQKVVAAQPQDLSPTSTYLIKMDRKNPYFEFKKYKFTKENPYAIMPATDAQEILTTEEGFRQAFPAELAEYYDRA